MQGRSLAAQDTGETTEGELEVLIEAGVVELPEPVILLSVVELVQPILEIWQSEMLTQAISVQL